MNVWEDTTLGDGNVTQKLVQLLIVADGELKVTWDDTGLLVVAGCVSGQLENLSGEVLKDGSEVNWGTCEWISKWAWSKRVWMEKRTGTNALGVVSLAEKTVDTTDWECETSLGRAAIRMKLAGRR